MADKRRSSTRHRGAAGDILLVLPAAALFLPLFLFEGLGPLDFWNGMALSAVLLVLFAFIVDRGYAGRLRNDPAPGPARGLLWGAASAGLLYLVFLAGDQISRLLFSFAGDEINRVYALKAGVSSLRVGLLIALVIGPGEELFWRGFLQHRWQERFGRARGYLAASGLYALAHLPTLNPMLILAAAVCGLFWGGLYLRFRSVRLVLISHVLWDLTVFLVLPF